MGVRTLPTRRASAPVIELATTIFALARAGDTASSTPTFALEFPPTSPTTRATPS